MDKVPQSPPSVVSAGLRARCPRCGKGRLFSGFLTVAPRCEVCGLDFSKVDSGDGPAVFVILIVGFLVVGAALFAQILFDPPYWLQLVIWIPTILGLSLGLLRPLKSTFVALQYRHLALGPGPGDGADDGLGDGDGSGD